MSATLTISVSERVLTRLKERAAAAGTTAEAVAAEAVTKAAEAPKTGDLLCKWAGAFDSGPSQNGTEPRPATDPFLQLAGSFTRGPGDVSLRHDDYIGEALFEELRGEKP
jgi:hypothetical protein